MGSGGIARHILNFWTMWKLVVSFTPRPLYPHGRKRRCPLQRVVGGPQNRSESWEKKILLLPGIDSRLHGYLTRSLCWLTGSEAHIVRSYDRKSSIASPTAHSCLSWVMMTNADYQNSGHLTNGWMDTRTDGYLMSQSEQRPVTETQEWFISTFRFF